jgi:hypothetical protein
MAKVIPPTNRSWRRQVVDIAVGTAIVCGILLGGLWLLAHLAFSSTEEVTDPREYESLLKQGTPSEQFAHFPPVVPSKATDVRMSYLPKFLQGGGHLQLHVVLPAEEVAAVESSLAPRALHRVKGANKFEFEREQDIVTTEYFTGSKTTPGLTPSFPASFDVYVLHSRPYMPKGWNHGDTAGVSIDRATGEVVYWADWW